MLIIVAFALLLFLPSPWNLVAFGVAGLLGIGELFFWNRTVRDRRKQVGAGTLIGRTATVVSPFLPRGRFGSTARSGLHAARKEPRSTTR